MEESPTPQQRPPRSPSALWLVLIGGLIAVVGGTWVARSHSPAAPKADAALKLPIKERYKGLSRPSSDPVLGRELIPNAGHGQPIVNDLGYVGRRFAKERAPNSLRIIGFGDANSMYYAAEEQSYLSLLQTSLGAAAAGKSVEVLNFAVDGDTVRSEVRRLEVAGLAYKPDVVVIGFDADDVIDFKSVLSEVTGTAVADPTGPGGAAAVDAFYQHLGKSQQVKQAFYDKVFASAPWRDTVMALNELDRLAKANGFAVVVLALPMLAGFEPHQLQPLHDAVRVQAERHDFGYVDLSPSFAKVHDFGEFREAGDVFTYAPKAHAIVAEAVRDHLEKVKRVPALTETH